MDEIAALTPSYSGVSFRRLDRGEQLHWPVKGPDHPGTPILHIGEFTRGKGKFHAIDDVPPAELPDAEYPILLTTGRVLYHWHGGEMTRRAKGLLEIYPEPLVEIHPEDALYQPTANSLQPTGRRVSSDTSDSRFNVKAGWTPNETDEYTVNFTKQMGEKGAPLNVFNNPPVPPNSYWRWPYWDIQNTSFLSRTPLGAASYLKTKVYYNTFENGLDAFDDATYTTQSANGRFRSPYDDHAYGSVARVRNNPGRRIRSKPPPLSTDVHTEQQTNRPTHPTLSSAGAAAGAVAEHLVRGRRGHRSPHAGGGPRRRHQLRHVRITKAEEFNAARGLFEYPKGGSNAPTGRPR